MDDKKRLITEIEDFRRVTNMAAATFGRLSLKNPNFVSDLNRDDFSPKLKTATRIRSWMKNYLKKFHKDNANA